MRTHTHFAEKMRGFIAVVSLASVLITPMISHAEDVEVNIISAGAQIGTIMEGTPGTGVFNIVLSRSNAMGALSVPLTLTELPVGTTVSYDTSVYAYPATFADTEHVTHASLVITTSALTPSGSTPFTVSAPNFTSSPATLYVFPAPTPYTISGKIFNDISGNGGAFTAGADTPLAGWTITATNTGDSSQAATATTDSGGTYTLTIQNAGVYTVCPTAPTGWTLSYPSATCENMTVIAQDTTAVDFGYWRNGEVSGKSYELTATDTTIDGSDPLSAGWVITATPVMNDGTPDPARTVKTATTDVNASYTFQFPNTDFGRWIISETAQAGWNQTYPHTTNMQYVVDVGSNTLLNTTHFGNWRIVTTPPPTSSGSGGGGGGNGPIVQNGSGSGGGFGPTMAGILYGGGVAPTPSVIPGISTQPIQPAQQVLGASTFRFNENLWFGQRLADVTALHTFLISRGYLTISAPTGWFGPLTLQAIKRYQKDRGIAQTGIVGVLTRTALNSEL
jgi:hypothetical protein